MLKEDNIWVVTQSGKSRKRAGVAIARPASPRPAGANAACCLCEGDDRIVMCTGTVAHPFCSACVQRLFGMDSFLMFHSKFGGGGVTRVGAWCLTCIDGNEVAKEVGLFPLALVAHDEATVTQWRQHLAVAEHRAAEISKQNLLDEIAQLPEWRRLLESSKEVLCTRCPVCFSPFLFEDGCVALKCTNANSHPGNAPAFFCCYCDLVLSDSATCHSHAAGCQRRPPGAEGFFPGNEHWVRAVRTIMCMHTLHVRIWSIPDEEDFRQVYENMVELLGQLATNTFTDEVERNYRVQEEIVTVRGWQWCLPDFTSVPSQVFVCSVYHM
jgi:hypothetical protein